MMFMKRKTQADFGSTSGVHFALPVVKESSRDCFAFFPTSGLWLTVSRGVAETYRKKQVGSSLYRQPRDCKQACDVKATRKKEAGSTFKVHSGNIQRPTGKNRALCFPNESVGRAAPVLHKLDNRAGPRQGGRRDLN